MWLSLVLGEVAPIPSLLQLQAGTKLPQWQRWVGYKDQISHDPFGYASQRMDPGQTVPLGQGHAERGPPADLPLPVLWFADSVVQRIDSANQRNHKIKSLETQAAKSLPQRQVEGRALPSKPRTRNASGRIDAPPKNYPPPLNPYPSHFAKPLAFTPIG